ncbi:MAG: PstS family phosphate ABC transporter substrate-binding protein, partial [Usitatibacteraceae bacterium]
GYGSAMRGQLLLVLATLMPSAHAVDGPTIARPPPAGLPAAYSSPADAKPAPPAPPRILVDPAMSVYARAAALAGTVRSVGSSTLSNLLFRWATDFKLAYSNVEISIVGGGSDAAPLALLAGSAELAPMSRPMNATETKAFETKFGYPPTRLTVALDAIAVYVNKKNPLTQASLEQIDAIFSSTQKRGHAPIKTWGQLGLAGEWQSLTIELKGPNRAQGIYGLFRELALEGGDFRIDMKSEPVASSIVQGVGADEQAIGFASYFYASARARPLAVSKTAQGPFVLPTQEGVLSGSYPLSRMLYIYVNKPPRGALPAATLELLRFICTEPGQTVAARDGNYPLDARLARDECLGQLQ